MLQLGGSVSGERMKEAFCMLPIGGYPEPIGMAPSRVGLGEEQQKTERSKKEMESPPG